MIDASFEIKIRGGIRYEKPAVDEAEERKRLALDTLFRNFLEAQYHQLLRLIEKATAGLTAAETRKMLMDAEWTNVIASEMPFPPGPFDGGM